MFKVVISEIKKMLSRPGIYILAAFLALVLILGAFVYNPKPIEDNSLVLDGDTYIQKYTEFSDPDDGIKVNYDKKIDKISSYITYFITTNGEETITRGNYIKSLFKDYQDAYEEYYQSYFKEMVSVPTAQSLKQKMSEKLIAFNEEIQTAISNSANGCYAIVTTNANYTQYFESYNEVLNWSKATITEKENIKDDCKNYRENYKNKFETSCSNFIYPTLTTAQIKKYTDLTDSNSKFYELNLRLIAINKVIEDNKQICQTDEEKNISLAPLIDDLANQYVNTINTYVNLINYEMIVNAYNSTPTESQLDLKYLSNISFYNAKSLLTRYNYIFDSNKVEEEFAKPLTIGVTSNNNTNAYDYAYFVLRLFSFVIIFYSIMTISKLIAGEQKDGTLRYLATRPITRNQIFFGKLLSVLLMAFILIIFSSIISLCVGGAVYGFKSLDILTIFNGQYAMVIAPIGMLLIYMLSMFIEIVIYTSIAYFISILLNSDLLAVTITIVITVVNLLLPVFINGVNTWLAFYPFSHISLFSLFGSTVFAPSGDFFNLLLGAKVYSTTSLIVTISVLVTIIILSWILSLIKFKKKEL